MAALKTLNKVSTDQFKASLTAAITNQRRSPTKATAAAVVVTEESLLKSLDENSQPPRQSRPGPAPGVVLEHQPLPTLDEDVFPTGGRGGDIEARLQVRRCRLLCLPA